MEEENKTPITDGSTVFGFPLWVVGIVVVVLLILLGYLVWSSNSRTDSDNGQKTEEVMNQDETNSSQNGNNTSKTGTQNTGPTRVFENGYYITIIHFDGMKFTPQDITINAGEAVRFVNDSTLSMRVGSRVENLSSVFYSSLKQPNVQGAGATFEVTLPQPGTWAYENLPTASGARAIGVVNVR